MHKSLNILHRATTFPLNPISQLLERSPFLFFLAACAVFLFILGTRTLNPSILPTEGIFSKDGEFRVEAGRGRKKERRSIPGSLGSCFLIMFLALENYMVSGA